MSVNLYFPCADLSQTPGTQAAVPAALSSTTSSTNQIAQENLYAALPEASNASEKNLTKRLVSEISNTDNALQCSHTQNEQKDTKRIKQEKQANEPSAVGTYSNPPIVMLRYKDGSQTGKTLIAFRAEVEDIEKGLAKICINNPDVK